MAAACCAAVCASKEGSTKLVRSFDSDCEPDAPEVLTEIVRTWTLHHQHGDRETMRVSSDGSVLYAPVATESSACCAVPKENSLVDAEKQLGSLTPTSGATASKGWRYRVDRAGDTSTYDLLRMVDGELLLMRRKGSTWTGARGTQAASSRGTGGNVFERCVQVSTSLLAVLLVCALEWESIVEVVMHSDAFEWRTAFFIVPLALDVFFTRPVFFVGYCRGDGNFDVQSPLRLAWLGVMFPLLLAYVAALSDVVCQTTDPLHAREAGEALRLMLVVGLLHTTGTTCHLLPAAVGSALRWVLAGEDASRFRPRGRSEDSLLEAETATKP